MAARSSNQGRGFAAMSELKRKGIDKKSNGSQGNASNSGNSADDAAKAQRANARGGAK